MRRLSCCLILALLAPTCQGHDQTLVWVLGSYSKQSNARKEQARLTDELGQAVSIMETDAGLYRVVVPAERVSHQAISGLNAWLLLSGQPAERLTTQYRVSNPTQEDPPLMIEEPQKEPLYPAFNPGESISQYCVRLPDSRLCQHPGIEPALQKDRKLVKLRGKIGDSCKIVTDPTWRQTCLSLH